MCVSIGLLYMSTSSYFSQKENRDLSPLESEINDARKRDSATRAKAVEQDEAEKVETEKEQSHKGTLMESGIHDNILKEMQKLLVQCLDEANREKETLQNEITEKERELSSAKDEKVELYTQLQSEKKRVAQLEVKNHVKLCMHDNSTTYVGVKKHCVQAVIFDGCVDTIPIHREATNSLMHILSQINFHLLIGWYVKIPL